MAWVAKFSMKPSSNIVCNLVISCIQFQSTLKYFIIYKVHYPSLCLQEFHTENENFQVQIYMNIAISY